MSADILILPDDLDAPWVTRGHILATPDDKRTLSGREMTVILSGQRVRTLPHSLPALKPRERLQAARFHVEPLVGEATDSLHIALADTRLSAISTRDMDAIMAALADIGVIPVAIHTDHDVLPPATLPDRTIIDNATLDPGFPLDATPPLSMTIAEAIDQIDTSTAIDLLSGPYALRRFPALAELGPLRWAAALPLLLGLSWILLQGAESRAEAAQIAALRQQASDAYTTATGTTVADPAQAVRALAAPVESATGLDHLAVLYAALATQPDVGVESLRYDETRDRLDIRFTYPGFAATSDVEAAVASAGGRLDAGGVRESGGQFIGDAVLTIGAR